MRANRQTEKPIYWHVPQKNNIFLAQKLVLCAPFLGAKAPLGLASVRQLLTKKFKTPKFLKIFT